MRKLNKRYNPKGKLKVANKLKDSINIVLGSLYNKNCIIAKKKEYNKHCIINKILRNIFYEEHYRTLKLYIT